MGLAPAWALPLAIKRAGLTPIRSTFGKSTRRSAPRRSASSRELPNQLDGFVIPDEKITPNGGAVAIGHPFGATGGRYVLALATELHERGLATARSACVSDPAKAWLWCWRTRTRNPAARDPSSATAQ